MSSPCSTLSEVLGKSSLRKRKQTLRVTRYGEIESVRTYRRGTLKDTRTAVLDLTSAPCKSESGEGDS